jgi:hypothetical protein
MGIHASKNQTFIDEIKVDYSSKSKILGIYLSCNEFPESGLIVVTSQCNKNLNKLYSTIHQFRVNSQQAIHLHHKLYS